MASDATGNRSANLTINNPMINRLRHLAIKVKVCVSSSLIVQQILSNARNLRQSAKFKTVFLSPDRSPQERESRRELIASMRARALEEPDKKFYIRERQILSASRNDKRLSVL